MHVVNLGVNRDLVIGVGVTNAIVMVVCVELPDRRRRRSSTEWDVKGK